MRRLFLATTAAAFLAGCEYEQPLSTEPTIPIDRAILGAWKIIEDPEAPSAGDDRSLVVLEFSPNEYLVRDPDSHCFRGLLVDIGGHRLLQLHPIGSDAGPPRKATGYYFGSFALDGGSLTFSLLNDSYVPQRTAKTTADIRAAILANRDKPDLFGPFLRMRRGLLPPLHLPRPSFDQLPDRDIVETAALTPDGRRLVVGLHSGHMATIDLVDGSLAWSVKAFDKPVRLLAFGESDRWILSAGDDLRATLQSGDNGKRFMTFEAAPLRMVYDIALSGDARFAATRGFDGFAKVQDLRTNEEICSFISRGFAFAPGGRLLVSTPQLRPGAEIFQIPPDPRDAAPQRILEGHRVNGVAVGANGKTLAATGGLRDGMAVVWLVEATTGHTLHEIRLPRQSDAAEAAAHAVAFSADGKLLVAGSSDGQIVRIDVSSGTILDTWHVAEDTAAHRVGFVGDDIWVTVLGDVPAEPIGDQRPPVTTRLYRPGVAEPVWTVVGEASFAANQEVAASITDKGDLMLFNRADGQPLRRLRPYAKGARWYEDAPTTTSPH